MDPTNTSTPPPAEGSSGPSTPIRTASDPFNVDELSAQLPAVQQQQVDSHSLPVFATPPYEEDEDATEQDEDYDYESPTPPRNSRT